MKKIVPIRKDIRPGYHPYASVGVDSRKGALIPHNCTICRHPDKEEIERKYSEGWRLTDIMRAHPWMKSLTPLQMHIEITGLKDAVAKQRVLDTQEILDRIIRAGLPVLEEGKVYPRDIIEAVKALNELKNKDRTDSLWELIFKRKEDHGSPVIVTTASPA